MDGWVWLCKVIFVKEESQVGWADGDSVIFGIGHDIEIFFFDYFFIIPDSV